MQRAELGADLVAYGVISFFKPWYFDGSTVYWAHPEDTKSNAMESAERMKALLTKAST